MSIQNTNPGFGGGQSASAAAYRPRTTREGVAAAVAPGSCCETEAFKVYSKLLGNRAKAPTEVITLTLQGKSYTKLDSIPKGLATTFPNLKHLSLAGNDIGKVKDAYFGGVMQNLETFNLSSNGLTEIQLTRRIFPNLKELNIYTTALPKYIRDAMDHYRKYKERHDAYWRNRRMHGIAEDRGKGTMKYFLDPELTKPSEDKLYPITIHSRDIHFLPVGCKVILNGPSYSAIMAEQRSSGASSNESLYADIDTEHMHTRYFTVIVGGPRYH